MTYGKTYITTKGAELALKTLQSKSLEFSKFVIGNGAISSDSVDTIKALTNVINPMFTMAITNIVEAQENQLTISGLFKNTDVEESFYLKEIGLYAINLETNEEILFAYINYGDKADYINTSISEKKELYFDMIVKVDNADNVVINIDSSTVYATDKQLNEHVSKLVNSDSGVHGFRYYDDTFQFYDEGSDEWVDIETGGGIAPANVVNPKIKVGNQKATISWGDPENTVLNGQTICTWKGTKLVYKAGSYPIGPNDGILVLDSQIRNAYLETGFEINNLTNGVTYYFQLFPYSDKKVYNKNEVNRTSGTPNPYKTMTIEIDLSNSNPTTCCTYKDDAIKMEAGSSSWDEFFGHYPCLFKEGEEVGKLNPNNFAQFEDGSPADITSGDAGDVMIAFPRHGLKINIVDNILTISMTDDPDNENFKYYAHSRDEERREKFYLGAYKGYNSGHPYKLRSLSGKSPSNNNEITYFRSCAQENGDGYELSSFYQLIFRQAMYLLKYKNLDSQTAIGKGFTAWLISDIPASTGKTNKKGMDCGDVSGTIQMKLFGLEDFWGSLQEWVDGIKVDSEGNIFTATTNFNDENTYIKQKHTFSSGVSGHMTEPIGSTELGFFPKKSGGSTATYFCDYFKITKSSSCHAAFGGNWNSESDAGMFCFMVDTNTNSTSRGARLMYL